MSIRKQVILAMAFLTVVVSTVLSLILYFVISKGFDHLEDNIVQQNIERVYNSMENFFISFKAKAGDWARWDDTYDFVDDLNEEYIRENIIADAFFTLEMNFVIYYNQDLQPVYKSAVSFKTKEFVEFPQEMIQQLSKIITKEVMSRDEPIANYIQLPGKSPIIFVAYPILHSDGSGPPNGVMVFARYLDEDIINRLEKITLYPLELRLLDDVLPEEFVQVKQELENKPERSNLIVKREGSDLYGYTLVRDIFNVPAFLFKINIPRELEQQGNRTILFVVLTVMFAGVIFGLTVYVYMERTVLTRLLELGKGISRISTSDYKKVGLYVTGNDEIGELAKEIENMVLSLYTVQLDLSRSNERYKGVIESQVDFIIRKDINNRVVFVNDAYCRKFGLIKENVLGSEIDPFSLMNEKSISFEAILKKLAHPPYRIALEERMKAKKGWCWIAWEYAAIKNKLGEIIEVQGVGRDITLLKKNEKTLKRRAEELEKLNISMVKLLEDIREEKNLSQTLAKDLEKFKLAVENASDLIVITDVNGFLLYANKALAHITGFKQEEVIGKTPGQLWGGNMEKGFYVKMWHTIKKEKQVFIGECNNRRKNGEKYIAELKIAPILDEKERVIFFVGVERDITRMKEIDKMKSEFISVASHQLRTPLTGIKWFSELMLQNKAGVLTNDQHDFIQQIYESNERMIKLVNDLLNVSHIESGTKFVLNKKSVDLIPLIKTILEEEKILAKEKKIELNTKEVKGKCRLFIDGEKIQQVVQNLISNAIKYSSSGSEVMVSFKKGKKDVTFSVKDSGVGINTEQQGRIFEKFFRAKNVISMETDGNGLGLYIAKAIIEAHGGKIWFDSQEKKGTTFYFSLPVKKAMLKVSPDAI